MSVRIQKDNRPLVFIKFVFLGGMKIHHLNSTIFAFKNPTKLLSLKKHSYNIYYYYFLHIKYLKY